MTNTRRRMCALFALALFPNLLSAAVTLRLAYSDVESYPFQAGNGHLVADPPGLALELLNHVAGKLDIEIDYVRRPGQRVLHEVKTGRADGGFIFSYNEERAGFARYPMKDGQPDTNRRVATMGYYFYTLKGHLPEREESGLPSASERVGAHLGYSVVRDLEQRGYQVHEVKTTEQLFSLLLSGRLEVIALQETLASQYLRDKSWAQVERIEPAISAKPYYLVFSQKFVSEHPQLAQRLWDEIGASREKVMAEAEKRYPEGGESR